MIQPKHVLDWNRARTEEQRNALLDEWLLEMRWQIDASGRLWRSELDTVNYAGDVFFRIKVPDPSDSNTTFFIEAPFERFLGRKEKAAKEFGE